MIEENSVQVPQRSKKRCKNCNKTQFFYDKVGIHIKCSYCRTVTSFTWEELQAMYNETSSQQSVLFPSQTA